MPSPLRERIEYWLVLAVARPLGWIPRSVARRIAGALAWAVFRVHGRLRRVGGRNLEMALPQLSSRERQRILRGVFRYLSWQLVEFCRTPGYTVENTRDWLRTQGIENYLAAQAHGKGVLIATGHLGAWEISGIHHSMMGHLMSVVVRPLDNRLLDKFVNGNRSRLGNRMLPKNDFARGLLTAMRAGETVAILMDTNMTPPQGAFVNFFGIPACTATGLAHMARKTGAAVLPAFMVWEPGEGKYVLHFGQELKIPHTEDVAADILAITQLCNDAIESWVRRYPDQWLWIHRRWKTRPPGEPSLY